MKNIILLLIAFVSISSLFVSCDEDEWSNGDPAYDHVYYVGFEDWADYKNSVKFNVNQGDTVGIPVQFFSENALTVDVVTYYYIAGDLQLGVDFEVVDASGSALIPDSNGAFSLIWPEATKGVQRVYVKALSTGATGSFLVQTFDPADAEGISYTNTVNNVTNDYEVRAFTQNYKVTVNIK
ncbi:hypothetical protein SAMN05444285_10560 [Draconibacterium orientale]|uniref:Uncharacterized protein n=1 Tax=Draconibacterium orientale TaxID=1168034 RepID=X5DJ81_9BACT|nr:hypothetical protein [Draconibacterium orientale]AHW60597.1 hypothetical protein FH5T_15710 [Draconibacterium orientale]SET04560.1 hypothetical protein SAMN05444285_10560 [Draconibacterium orientale]